MRFNRFILSIVFLTTPLWGFENFYVGISTGPDALAVKQSGSALALRGLAIPVQLNADLFDVSWDGVFYGGYGKRWGILYGACEAFVKYSSHHFSETKNGRFILVGPTDIRNEVKNKIIVGPWHYGFDFRPGLFLNPITLLYGRFGVEWTRRKFTSSARFVNTGSVAPSDLLFSVSKQKWTPRFRLGLGIEKYLSKHLSLKVDYVFTNYGHFSINKQNRQDISFWTDSTKVKLNDHSLLVGLSYYFSQFHPNYNFDPLPPERLNFQGPYLAGNLGAAFLNARLKGTAQARVISPGSFRISPVTFPSRIIAETVEGALYTGLGLQHSAWYVGVEAFGQYAPSVSKRRTDASILISGATLRSAAFETKTTFRPWEFGIELRPGFLLNSTTLIYGALGSSYAKIKGESNGSALYTAPNASLKLFMSEKSNRVTFKAGFGVENALSLFWHLRADYRFTDYGNLHFRGSIVTASPGVTAAILSSERKIHFKSHSLTLGVARYF